MPSALEFHIFCDANGNAKIILKLAKTGATRTKRHFRPSLPSHQYKGIVQHGKLCFLHARLTLSIMLNSQGG